MAKPVSEAQGHQVLRYTVHNDAVCQHKSNDVSWSNGVEQSDLQGSAATSASGKATGSSFSQLLSLISSHIAPELKAQCSADPAQLPALLQRCLFFRDGQVC